MAMKRKAKLYHATRLKFLDSIMKEGLLPSPWDRLVYMSDSPGGAYGFMHMRAYDVEEIDMNIPALGGMTKVPNVIKDSFLYVIEVNTKALEWSRMEEGTDHNPMFFSGNVYAYTKTISPEHFSRILEIDLESHTVVFQTAVKNGKLVDDNFVGRMRD